MAPEVIVAVKRATVRIGLLDVGNSKLIDLGSGTIVDGGVGSPTNQVLSAAHVFIDHRDPSLRPQWVTKCGMPTDIDWTSDAAPLILAIGMWESDEKPSKWMYWAELVTPLATLQELRETPQAPHHKTDLLDLAVLRIRGRLELDPPEYTPGLLSTEYSLTKKHVAGGASASDLSLPAGRPLGKPVKTHESRITCFGWFAPKGETTLHVPDSKVVQSIERGLIVSQVVLHAAGSGGATVDHRGEIVGVNSRSRDPEWFKRNDYKAYMRMVSCDSRFCGLLPAH